MMKASDMILLNYSGEPVGGQSLPLAFFKRTLCPLLSID